MKRFAILLFFFASLAGAQTYTGLPDSAGLFGFRDTVKSGSTSNATPIHGTPGKGYLNGTFLRQHNLWRKYHGWGGDSLYVVTHFRNADNTAWLTLNQGAALSDTTIFKLKTDSTDGTGYFTVYRGNLKAPIASPTFTGTVTTPLGAGTVRSSSGGVLSATASDTVGMGAAIAGASGNFKASCTGQPILTDSVRFIDGSNITLTQSGHTVTIAGAAAVSGANPTASVNTTVVNGVASTFMRSDAAPPVDQSMTPTWTGLHIFNNSSSAIRTPNIRALTGTGNNIVMAAGATGQMQLGEHVGWAIDEATGKMGINTPASPAAAYLEIRSVALGTNELILSAQASNVNPKYTVRQNKVTTTDAVSHNVDSITVPSNGILTWTVRLEAGRDSSSALAEGYSTIQTGTYFNRGGNLTLAADSSHSGRTAGSGVSGWSMTFGSNASQQAVLQLIGQASTTIRWIMTHEFHTGGVP